MSAPSLWVIAGPNGAGKSTLTARRVRGRLPVVDPDAIARRPVIAGNPLAAGRVAIRERAHLIAVRASFAIETTLTGLGEQEFVRAAKSAGYRVGLVYVGLPGVEHSILRVRERVRRGGHDVPLADLERRFDRSRLGAVAACALIDRLIVLQNDGRRMRLLLAAESGRIKYRTIAMPGWAEPLLGALEAAYLLANNAPSPGA